MSPSSSTSDSEGLRYLVVVAVGTCLVLTVVLAIVQTSRILGLSPFPYEQLAKYQARKIERIAATGTVPHTVFLGDSSLGNAIDASLWSRWSGTAATNLALTNFYGYAGDYNFLRRILRVGRPHNVVLMHAARVMLRPENPDAFAMTKGPDESSLVERTGLWWRLNMNVDQLHASALFLRQRFSGRAVRLPPTAVRGDYVVQGPRIAPHSQSYEASRIVKEKLHYLALVGDLCRSNGLTCLYVHGPLAESTCRQSSGYFERVASMIESTGIKVVGVTPPCMATDEVGDSDDHVRPELKAKYTERYRELLGAAL